LSDRQSDASGRLRNENGKENADIIHAICPACLEKELNELKS
jgi:hypothetical protein